MFEGMFEIFNEEKKEDEDTEVTYPSSEPQSSSSAPSYYSSSNTFVVSVGGSVLVKGKPDPEAISAISQALNQLIRDGKKLVLVVGGGKIARDYVSAASSLGANNFELDELGIRITRANASLLIPAIDNAFPEIMTDVKKCMEILEKGKTPIFGGLMPGFTTDAVAALLAEYLGATFVNLSNVDGIFTADPAAYPSARLYQELGYDKLLEILSKNTMKPGQNIVLDLPAAMILKRSGLTAFFLNGHDTENFKAALSGMQFRGTVVKEGAAELLDGEEEPAPRKRKRVVKKKAKKKTKKKAGHYEEDEEPHPGNIRF